MHRTAYLLTYHMQLVSRSSPCRNKALSIQLLSGLRLGVVADRASCDGCIAPLESRGEVKDVVFCMQTSWIMAVRDVSKTECPQNSPLANSTTRAFPSCFQNCTDTNWFWEPCNPTKTVHVWTQTRCCKTPKSPAIEARTRVVQGNCSLAYYSAPDMTFFFKKPEKVLGVLKRLQYFGV